MAAMSVARVLIRILQISGNIWSGNAVNGFHSVSFFVASQFHKAISSPSGTYNGHRANILSSSVDRTRCGSKARLRRRVRYRPNAARPLKLGCPHIVKKYPLKLRSYAFYSSIQTYRCSKPRCDVMKRPAVFISHLKALIISIQSSSGATWPRRDSSHTGHKYG